MVDEEEGRRPQGRGRRAVSGKERFALHRRGSGLERANERGQEMRIGNRVCVHHDDGLGRYRSIEHLIDRPAKRSSLPSCTGLVTNENLRNAVRVTVIATGFEQEPEVAKTEPATRRGPAAAAPANGRNGNGHANGNGKAAAETEAEAPARRSVGGFMRRMWGRGSAQV